MDFELIALEPSSTEYKLIRLSEWAWGPIRSMLAICYFIECKSVGEEPDTRQFEIFKELDCCMGEGFTSPSMCSRLGSRLNNLLADPEVVEDYGMTVNLIDGNFVLHIPHLYVRQQCITGKIMAR